MNALVAGLILISNSLWGASETPGGLRSTLGPMVPLLLMFGIFYFLVLRPQQKKAKTHEKFLTELKRGEMVVTNAGIIGTVKNLSEKFVTLEVDEGVCLKILRNQISESAGNLKDKEDNKSKSTLQPQEEKR